jgi:hypothetical protein
MSFSMLTLITSKITSLPAIFSILPDDNSGSGEWDVKTIIGLPVAFKVKNAVAIIFFTVSVLSNLL